VRSLRARALAAAAGISALALGICALAVYAAVRATLIAEFDNDLAARLRAYASTVEVERSGFEVHLPEGEEYGAAGDVFFLVRVAGGSSLARSASLGGRNLPTGGGTIDEPALASLELDGMRLRSATAAWTARRGGGTPREAHLEAAMARRTDGLDATLARIATLLTGVTAAAALACGLAMAAAMRRALSPLEALARRIGEVDDRSLGTRLGDAGTPRELAPVVERLDGLLARLEQAFAREKRFGAAAAHELRTPLAGLRAAIELALARPREGDDYRRAFAECQEISRQMEAMVESLLLLARLDSGQVAPRGGTVDLGEALRGWWRSYDEAARARGLRTSWTCDGTRAAADRELLRLIAANLFDNAVSHAEEGGELAVSCGVAEGRARFEVANGGCRLAPEQVERVFDRFWRGDAGRGATGRHCGLGLSLCRDLARVLGGTISARVEGGRFIARVELPSSSL
jgi:signal transduction histidine kinase